MKRRLAVIGIMAVAALALAGCFPPTIPIEDPDDPVIPVLTIPVAAFSFYSVDHPIQTGSAVVFDGGDSYDPDGVIVYGEWDFGDEEGEEGNWPLLGSWVWENGERVWVTIPLTGTGMVWHTYIETDIYTVELTVWDEDGNQSSTTHTVRVR